MHSQLPAEVGIGSLLSFEYPERNLIESLPIWKPRTLLIESILDTCNEPIDPLAVDLDPYKGRGRWLLTGLDLDLDQERSFYLEAMRNFRADSWRQLCLFDPVDGRIVYRDGKYPPTRRGMDFLRDVIRHFHIESGRRPSVLHNLGVFTWQPQYGRVA